MNVYYAFSDEAGLYSLRPTNKFIKNNPYYVRSTVLVKVKEYADFQKKIHKIKKKYNLPISEEIKWSDVWRNKKGNPRNEIIGKYKSDELLKYISTFFTLAEDIPSLKIILTVTKNGKRNRARDDTMLKYHIQDAFQRINNELKKKGFATFIVDEMSNRDSLKIKEICHEIIEKGDIVEYSTLYSGILFEKSNLSVGIQLADYVAGIFNNFLKSIDSNKNNYQYAREKFVSFIFPRIRRSNDDFMGYGILEVTRFDKLRNKIKEAILKEVENHDQL